MVAARSAAHSTTRKRGALAPRSSLSRLLPPPPAAGSLRPRTPSLCSLGADEGVDAGLLGRRRRPDTDAPPLGKPRGRLAFTGQTRAVSVACLADLQTKSARLGAKVTRCASALTTQIFVAMVAGAALSGELARRRTVHVTAVADRHFDRARRAVPARASGSRARVWISEIARLGFHAHGDLRRL